MLGQNWQIYSYMPGIPTSGHAPEVAQDKAESSSLPPFVQKALNRVANKLEVPYESKRDSIDCSLFYLELGYNEDDRIVHIYAFGVKDRDKHNEGLGKQILQCFFKSLAIYAKKEVSVTLWSVTTAIGFYLRCGMSVQAIDDTYIDPVDEYYKIKGELFGDEWDKYRVAIINELPDDEMNYDVLYSIFEKSDFYREGDHPGIFSVWIQDVVGDRAHHMIYDIQPRTDIKLIFQV